MDVEASVDEDEEDYDDDDDGLLKEDGFIQENDEGDEEEVQVHDDRLHREVDRRRDAIVEQDARNLPPNTAKSMAINRFEIQW